MAALTGTPGVGKTTIGKLLENDGYDVLDLNKFIKSSGLRGERDDTRKSYDIDIKTLKQRFENEPNYDIVEGHLSHHLSLSPAIVLRCEPSELKSRIEEGKDWSERKKKENIQAEAMDVILTEAIDLCDHVYEIDTTDLSPVEVKEAVEDIMKGKTAPYEPGGIDWSEYLWEMEDQ